MTATCESVPSVSPQPCTPDCCTPELFDQTSSSTRVYWSECVFDMPNHDSTEDAWGRVLSVYDANGTPLSESAVGNHYLWQGRWYSWKTGLYYFRARWYDPITGRWLSKDPIGIAGGLNQYVAFNNNPVNFRDPSGLEPITASVILGWVGYNAGSGALMGGASGFVFGGLFSRSPTWSGVLKDASFSAVSGAAGGAVGGLLTAVPIPGFDTGGGIASSRVALQVSAWLYREQVCEDDKPVANIIGGVPGFASEFLPETVDPWVIGFSSGVSAGIIGTLHHANKAVQNQPTRWERIMEQVNE